MQTGDRVLSLLCQPQVLFPGTTLPVRVSIPKSRRLVADAVKGDRIIATIAKTAGFELEDPAVRIGQVGCVAKIVSAKKLPHGHIRVVLEGTDRFAVGEIVASDPFLKVVATPYRDFEESQALLVAFAEEVRQYYTRYAKASGKIADATGSSLSLLPTDPVELSMYLPAMLNLDEESAQRFLSSRSTLMRLRELSALLAPAATAAEASADIHARSRSNGHGAKRS
jgi:ATP-dependent Lon protease